MKLNILFFLIATISVSTSSFSQSKEETINWIIKELSKHQLRSGNFGYSNYFINDGNIIEQHYWNTTGSFKLAYENKIPIKSISKISLERSEVGIIFNLTCKNNCSKNTSYDENEKVKSTSFSTSISIQIKNDDSSLVTRIPKAISHLVNLYGGKVTIAAAKKEPF